MPEGEACPVRGLSTSVAEAVGDRAADWDRSGVLPVTVLRRLGAEGVLCAQVPGAYGGRGLNSAGNGALTAYAGSLCSSLRSVMTSQGMAAWAVQRLGDAEQRKAHLPVLTSGGLAAVAFSEPGAGSDLAAMGTRFRVDGDEVVVTGQKTWVTAAHYADLIVVFGICDDGAAAVIVPVGTPGVRVRRIADPLGCRAAGHADVEFTDARVPAANLLGGSGWSLTLLVTSALTYGRLSVAWGCVGILRACLGAATAHARTRRQFGKRLGDHQLVARHIAELVVAEQIAARSCEHASSCWDDASPDLVLASVLAKHTSAVQAAHGAATAVQVLASTGADDGHVVARAYRDAKLMEIIEGSNEICQLILAQHALETREDLPGIAP
ncbi:acyl-CoA dehydrogenase family protein [Nocardiopsis ansamitocini]|uniref:Acyl-CoA dehydrogenase n=1 Tax=Nocardiopsis ansamitocini TaxID=1670832 RepID=A0A9W6P6R2_9ACTN|nr:acyl-CoA dehydrogenase family protein [Nocardiopsis ansamitocini]GLU48161.1 acyl-CoA dehydrogenase [Nocardiopsis ansamitocini]